MRAGLLACICIALLLGCSGLKFVVEPGQQECLEEQVPEEEVQFAAKTTLAVDAAFQIKMANGALNANSRRFVDVVITNPNGGVVLRRNRVWKEAKLSGIDSVSGRYRLCLKNSGPSKTAVRVDIAFFTVTHADRAASDGLTPGRHVPADALASSEHLTQVHDLVSRIATLLRLVRGEQRYMRSRLAKHMTTSRSTHRRAAAYTSVELATLVIMTAAQVVTVHVLLKNRRASRGILGS